MAANTITHLSILPLMYSRYAGYTGNLVVTVQTVREDGAVERSSCTQYVSSNITNG